MSTRLWHLIVIAKVTMLEGARKQIFHVLMLFALTLIAFSTVLGMFDHNIQIKFVKDLCTVSILISSGLIAITLSVSGLPQEIESKTVYPVLAKPVKRWEFVLGKYLGTLGTVGIGMLVMLAALSAVLRAYTGGIDPLVMLVMPFLLLEAAILAALGQFLSTFCAPPLAWFLAVIGFFLGNAKFEIFSYLTNSSHGPFLQGAGYLLYQVLPNLECFNFKDALVHHIPVSTFYMCQTLAYGILYTVCLVTLSSFVFARKEL